MDKLLSDEELRESIKSEVFIKGTHTNDISADVEHTVDRVEALINTQKRAAVGAALEHQQKIQSSEYKLKRTIEEQRARIK